MNLGAFVSGSRTRAIGPGPAKKRREAAIRKAIAKLPGGLVAIEAARRMFLGRTARVAVTVGVEPRDVFIAKLKTQEDLQIDETKVGDRMTVELFGPKFAINPIGTAERLFGGRETWLFDVTPHRVGALLAFPGEEKAELRYAPVKEVEVRVRVASLVTVVTFIGKHAWGGLLEHWVYEALVGGTAAALFTLASGKLSGATQFLSEFVAR